MALTAQTPPKQERQSKYQYTPEDANAALDMLADGQLPGDSGFDTPGQARGAANALLSAIGRIDGATETDYGTRVWGDDDSGYSFALKPGRKDYKGRAESNSGSKKK